MIALYVAVMGPRSYEALAPQSDDREFHPRRHNHDRGAVPGRAFDRRAATLVFPSDEASLVRRVIEMRQSRVVGGASTRDHDQRTRDHDPSGCAIEMAGIRTRHVPPGSLCVAQVVLVRARTSIAGDLRVMLVTLAQRSVLRLEEGCWLGETQVRPRPQSGSSLPNELARVSHQAPEERPVHHCHVLGTGLCRRTPSLWLRSAPTRPFDAGGRACEPGRRRERGEGLQVSREDRGRGTSIHAAGKRNTRPAQCHRIARR